MSLSEEETAAEVEEDAPAASTAPCGCEAARSFFLNMDPIRVVSAEPAGVAADVADDDDGRDVSSPSCPTAFFLLPVVVVVVVGCDVDHTAKAGHVSPLYTLSNPSSVCFDA